MRRAFSSCVPHWPERPRTHLRRAACKVTSRPPPFYGPTGPSLQAAGVPFARPVSPATESVLFNALPLLLLAGAYLLVAAALAPHLWRDREGAHPLDLATVAIFPALAFSATVLGILVLEDKRPLGGHLWVAFVAVLAAILPALFLLSRWSERGLLASRVRRAREAEELVSMRDRELGAVTA